jgi:hypothetical protein
VGVLRFFSAGQIGGRLGGFGVSPGTGGLQGLDQCVFAAGMLMGSGDSYRDVLFREAHDVLIRNFPAKISALAALFEALL